MKLSYGWYSTKQANYYGTAHYLDENGNEVEVSCVTDSSAVPSDYLAGADIKFVGMVQIDTARRSEKVGTIPPMGEMVPLGKPAGYSDPITRKSVQSPETSSKDVTSSNMDRMPGRHHRSVTDAARVMTEDPDADNRFRAANALEQIAPIEALGEFIKGLDDEYNLTRRACVNALVKINTKEAREALKKVLKDEDTDVRESAKRHLDASSEERLNAKLFQAVKEKDKELISQLLHDGADINATDEDGNSTLLHPTQYYDPEMIIFLLSLGANPHASPEGRLSPFLLACSYGEDLEFIAEAFLTGGTDISVQVEGKTIIEHMRDSDRYSDRVVDSVEKLFRRHSTSRKSPGSHGGMRGLLNRFIKRDPNP